jgi:hypothetical protein
MKRALLLLVVLAGCAYLATRWPLVDHAEAVREYRAGEETALQAAKAVVERLPGFRLVGAGSGAGGRALQAVYTTLPGLEHEVTVRIRRAGNATRVSATSKSRSGPIDFGQNARILEKLFAALDRELAS